MTRTMAAMEPCMRISRAFAANCSAVRVTIETLSTKGDGKLSHKSRASK
jgi:hypothetical protein